MGCRLDFIGWNELALPDLLVASHKVRPMMCFAMNNAARAAKGNEKGRL